MIAGCRLGRLAVLALALVIASLWGGSPAWAHVTVSAPGVVTGASDGTIIFRVPDESDTASTVGLKVQLPANTPITGVLVAPQQGWTATTTHTTLPKPIQTDDGAISSVVSEINWKADTRSGIKPGFFGEFTIIGNLPASVSTLTFKAIQAYSDGTQVAWIDESTPGATAEPDHPAITLHLPTGQHPSSTSATLTSDRKGSNHAAAIGVLLGAIGIALGATALLVALRRPALRRGREVGADAP